VEQNANLPLKVGVRGYVMKNGHITITNSSEYLHANEEVKKVYLGI